MLLQMYPTLLSIHSYWRWAVLLTAVIALVVAVTGLTGQRPFAPLGRKAGVLYIVALDMQFLIGLILYVASPLVQSALHNMAAAMKDHQLRFFAVEHLTWMIIAVALAHVGSVRSKRAATDHAKYRQMLIWYAISLGAILAGIPWWRPLFRSLMGT